jgi:hypothetical protein
MDRGVRLWHKGRVQPSAESCDAVVIGGGPAGSTAGNLLARAGRNVVVLELFFLIVRLQRRFRMRDPLPRSPVFATTDAAPTSLAS